MDENKMSNQNSKLSAGGAGGKEKSDNFTATIEHGSIASASPVPVLEYTHSILAAYTLGSLISRAV